MNDQNRHMSGTSSDTNSNSQRNPKRKTRRRYEIPGHLRFLTFSCYQQLPLFNNDAIKDVFAQRLAVVREQQSVGIIAWVIMPEHVHLLIQPKAQEYPVARFLRSLKGSVAKQVVLQWRRIKANRVLDRITTASGQQRFWQSGGGYDRNVVSQDEMEEKIGYIHQNPVRRRLVDRAIDWPWSSARWYAGDGGDGCGVVMIDPVA